MLRVVSAVFAVYVLWAGMDFLIHGTLLGSSYADHPELFRAQGEMDMLLLQLVVLARAAVFVKIYSWLISPKSILAGIIFGLLWGVGHGLGMGYGTYATMPIPLNMASTWFAGATIQGVLGGLLAALIVVKRDEPPP